jgi:hypothetical protein
LAVNRPPTALAKAEIELTNPEKSLISTVEPQGGEGSARQFRMRRNLMLTAREWC